ncbi:translation initiation factor eIF3 subunit g [Kappamyces sp. JEL0829]|nr:translation initiation factor eIF3 subunit g [Kappamyces sp. JEL0829]
MLQKKKRFMPTAKSTIPTTEVLKEEVEYKTNEKGQKVKVTRRILVKSLAMEERRKWTKFGECRGLPPGPDSNATTVGEDVFLKLSTNAKDLDREGADQDEDPLKKAIAAGAAKIVCRICKGDHWTSKCPFKDTYQPINEIKASAAEPASTNAEASPAAAGGKYVPPSRRGVAGAGPSGNAPPSRDEGFTVRLSNLSEDTTDADVRDLASRFGPVQRVFLARHRDTGTSKGFAFISFYDERTCDAAVAKLDGFGYDSLILRCERSKKT